jgi:hypothetical protein
MGAVAPPLAHSWKGPDWTDPNFQLSPKNEQLTVATNEWFALVKLSEEEDGRPTFYLVPRNLIATYCYVSYRLWFDAPGRGGRPHRESSIRSVRPEDFARYQDAWDLLGKPTDAVDEHLPDRIRDGLGVYGPPPLDP